MKMILFSNICFVKVMDNFEDVFFFKYFQTVFRSLTEGVQSAIILIACPHSSEPFLSDSQHTSSDHGSKYLDMKVMKSLRSA